MILQRKYDDTLLKWKRDPRKKPLIVDGARQVGKSYLVEQLFGKIHYKKVVIIDFLKSPQLNSIFDAGLSPEQVLLNIQLMLNLKFDVTTDLLVFEEIGFSQKAMDSLKYFHQEMPEVHLVATGSNIGLLGRFPVGQVERLTIHPLCFREFLWANDLRMLADFLENLDTSGITEVIHQQLWKQWLDYLYVGGMPAVVSQWVKQHEGANIIDCVKQVEKVKQQLLYDYRNDFGKFSEKEPYTSLQIERVFEAIPRQIMGSLDGNAPKFTFKGVLGKRNAGYEALSGPIRFLRKVGLIHQIHIVEGNVKAPLNVLKEDNRFKILLHDVGLLCALAGLSYQTVINESAEYKGFLAENFVLIEFAVSLNSPDEKQFFSWQSKGKAELEFLVETDNGIMPIEVKSGRSTKSKSLSSYINSQAPSAAFKLTGRNIPRSEQGFVEELPLYMSECLFRRLFG